MPNEMPEKFFTRSTTVVARVVGGETLIVPIRGKVGDLASIYSFNGTGTLIWQLLESPQSVEQLSAGVVREYAVENEQAQKDVAQFVGEMLSVGLVEVCQPPAMIAEAQAQAIARAVIA